MRRATLLASLPLAALAFLGTAGAQDAPKEPYLSNVRRLTQGDERSGEAYFSADGQRILFQAKRPGQAYYQIYVINKDGSGRRIVSTGKGKTTCAFFHPTNKDLFIYASSHLDTRTHSAPKPRTSRRYKWDYDDSFDIFLASLSTGKIVKRLTTAKGYDAECSVSPDGKSIAFTARRDKHADSIYLMNADGTGQRPLVRQPGVDCGGPFFSPDNKWVIYRASNKGSRVMQVYMTSLDGKVTRRLTRTPRVNWAPFFHPSGKYVAYAATAKGSYSDFDLFLTESSGSFKEVALTVHTAFDGLPAFSPDGKTIAWSSSRDGKAQIYLADFKLPPASAFTLQPTEPPPAPKGRGGAHGRPAKGGEKHGGASSRPTKGGAGHGAPSSRPAKGGEGGHGGHGGKAGEGGHEGHGHTPTTRPSSRPAKKGAHNGRASGELPPRGKALSSRQLAALLPGVERVTSANMLPNIAWLADDAREGRRAGTPKERAAAEWLAKRLAERGVRPGGMDGSWFETFDYARGGRLAKTGNAFALQGEAWTLGTDYRPLLYSRSAKVDAQLVFCGYGIRASEDHSYDDLDKVDVKGKIALVLTGGPQAQKGGSFGRKRPSVHEDLRMKVAACRDAGAAAVLLVRSKGKGWLRLSAGDPGIPVLQVKRERLERALGMDLRDKIAGIDMHGAPDSEHLRQRATLAVALERPRVFSQNVVGRVTGTETPDEVIVVGAHYDHLGMGGEGSLSPSHKAVHNGADDNASGCAGVLALADALRVAPPKRTVLFVFFGAEEEGLIGSKAFVESPPISLKRVVAMLNMDMIGRRDGRPLLVGGAGSSPAWAPLLQAAADRFGRALSTQQDGFGPSDHASFYTEGVPVFFLWTGTHEDYHRPSDDVAKIDREGLEYSARVAYSLLRGIDGLPKRPTYRKVPRKQNVKRVVTGERGAYFGSIPNYAQDGVQGVLLDGARAGTPAAKAGIKKGDVIVEFNGMRLNNIYDYVNALRVSKPGQKITVKVKRDGKILSLKATLGGR